MTASIPNQRATRVARANEAGFTLVELMVVVAIIALLAAVVIPNFVHARAQAAVSATEANMKQIATALELYYADHRTYPAINGPVGPDLFGGAANPYLTITPLNSLKREKYVFTDVAAGATPETFVLADPGVYDATTLTSLTAGAGGTAPCTTCTKINYSPQAGFYGT